MIALDPMTVSPRRLSLPKTPSRATFSAASRLFDLNAEAEGLPGIRASMEAKKRHARRGRDQQAMVCLCLGDSSQRLRFFGKVHQNKSGSYGPGQACEASAQIIKPSRRYW